MSNNKIFSLFQEFSEEKKAELDADRTINSDALLIDGMNTFMRVWSMYPTTNDNGDHIGGYTGFLKSIGHAIRLRKPTRCIVVFDGKGGSARRRKLFPDYKMKKKCSVSCEPCIEFGLRSNRRIKFNEISDS